MEFENSNCSQNTFCTKHGDDLNTNNWKIKVDEGQTPDNLADLLSVPE